MVDNPGSNIQEVLTDEQLRHASESTPATMTLRGHYRDEHWVYFPGELGNADFAWPVAATVQMAKGMPVARLAASVLGGCGHLLLRMQVCRASSRKLYEQIQLFWTAVVDQRISTSW